MAEVGLVQEPPGLLRLDDVSVSIDHRLAHPVVALANWSRQKIPLPRIVLPDTHSPFCVPRIQSQPGRHHDLVDRGVAPLFEESGTVAGSGRGMRGEERPHGIVGVNGV